MADPTSSNNPLIAANQAGQSLWLDYIQRSMIDSGELAALISNDHIAGLTSNPSIFEQAIAKTTEYDQTIKTLVEKDPARSDLEVFNELAIEDIQSAADAFAGVYSATNGVDGMVSLEVSPLLAHDTAGTVKSGLDLHQRVNRPNLMIKVPGTREGIDAFQQLTEAGVNVNVTLLFSVSRYREIAQAFIRGLEARAASGQSVAGIASVASFFVSRVDTEVDKAVEALGTADATALQGKIAIANAKVAYGYFANVFGSEQFKALEQQGAQAQRLLWASTGTKNKAYSDVMYVEELLGPSTVNTLPPATMDAFRDHGKAEVRLTQGLAQASQELNALADAGVSLNDITDALEQAGVKSFADAFDRLLQSIAEKRKTLTS
ncbi:MAG: transaldolase [Gammaproteobacteria bacterium]|nr:transaldolase [Gammaproteobacteria bacterium]